VFNEIKIIIVRRLANPMVLKQTIMNVINCVAIAIKVVEFSVLVFILSGINAFKIIIAAT